MTGTTAPVDPLAEWDAHLSRELAALKNNANSTRAYTFDMDDGPEDAHLKGFARLGKALAFLNTTLTPEYRAADRSAGINQTWHRWLANGAIFFGVLAICCAIVQLALKQSLPSWTGLVAELEYVAAGAALIAVVVGLVAKFNKRWFVKRHVAERLRMLKFRALGQPDLWADNENAWRGWVTAEIHSLLSIKKIDQVRNWSRAKVRTPEPVPPQCVEDEATNTAITTYYCRKRVDFQAHYFKKQSEKYERQSHPLHSAGLWLFFISVLAVLAHFVAEQFAGAATEADKHTWEQVGIWCIALAALLPVVSAGIRAWLGAFELARSADLFDANHASLVVISKDLLLEKAQCASTMRQIAYVERLLEDEHREWLRLLMNAEWFL